MKLKDGVVKEFYPTGALRTETIYRNGKKDGIQKKFRPNGELVTEVLYKEGEEIEKKLYTRESQIVSNYDIKAYMKLLKQMD